MASSDALPIPRKNVAYRVVFPILDADGDLVSGATGLDSEISKDQGTFADCTNEATEIATSSGMYYLDLTSTEMNADCVAVIVKTSSSGAKTTPIVLYPEELGDVRTNVGQWNGTAVPSEHTAGYPIVTVKDGTGTGEINTTSGRVDADITHIATAAVSASTAQLGVNVVNIGGSATPVTNIGVVYNTDFATNYSTTNDQWVVSSSAVASVTGAVGSVSGNVGGNVVGSVGSVSGNVGGNVTGSVGSVVGAVGSVSGNVSGSVGSLATQAKTDVENAVWNADATGHQTQGTFGQAIGDPGADSDTIWALANTNLDAAVSSRSSHSAADVWAVGTRTLTAIDEDSTTLDLDATIIAAVGTALTTTMTEGYRSTGSIGSVRDLMYEIIAHLGESSIVSTTKTLKKLDGSTTAKTYTLNDASTPTAITETT